MSTTTQRSSGAQSLLNLAAFVVVVAGLRAAQSIVVPFLLAVFFAIVCGPLLYWLQARRVPMAAALFLVILLLVVGVMAVVALVGASVNDFTRNLDVYQHRLEVLIGGLLDKLESWGLERPNRAILDSLDPKIAMGFAATMLSNLSGLFGNVFLILLTAIFILLEASGFPAKLRAMSGGSGRSVEQFNRIVGDIRRYMSIKTQISALTGVAITILLWSLGVDYAPLWGRLAFLLNFVPNIGSFIAAVPPVLLAAVQPGLGLSTALWTAAGLAGINLVVGNVIEPRLLGKGLGLSTLVVFVSLVFWGWVFGLVGMLLSAPLTMAVKIALEGADDTRWIAILLSSE